MSTTPVDPKEKLMKFEFVHNASKRISIEEVMELAKNPTSSLFKDFKVMVALKDVNDKRYLISEVSSFRVFCEEDPSHVFFIADSAVNKEVKQYDLEGSEYVTRWYVFLQS